MSANFGALDAFSPDAAKCSLVHRMMGPLHAHHTLEEVVYDGHRTLEEVVHDELGVFVRRSTSRAHAPSRDEHGGSGHYDQPVCLHKALDITATGSPALV